MYFLQFRLKTQWNDINEDWKNRDPVENLGTCLPQRYAPTPWEL